MRSSNRINRRTASCDNSFLNMQVNFDDLPPFGVSSKKSSSKSQQVVHHEHEADEPEEQQIRAKRAIYSKRPRSLSVQEIKNSPFLLQNKWKLYYDEGTTNYDDYESSIVCIGCFDTVQEFWNYWNNLKIELMPEYCNLRLFKHDVKPLWEHERNINGSKWAVSLKDNQQRTRLWTDLVLAIVGEKLVCSDDLCGVVLSCRSRGLNMCLWNGGDLDSVSKSVLSRQVQSALHLSDEEMLSVDYARHKETMEDHMKNAPSIKKTTSNSSVTNSRKGHHSRSNSRNSFSSANSSKSPNNSGNTPNSLPMRAPVDRKNSHQRNKSFDQSPENMYLRAERSYVRRSRNKSWDDNADKLTTSPACGTSTSSGVVTPVDYNEISFAYPIDNDQCTVSSTVASLATFEHIDTTEIDITDSMSTTSTCSLSQDIETPQIEEEEDYLNIEQQEMVVVPYKGNEKTEITLSAVACNIIGATVTATAAAKIPKAPRLTKSPSMTKSSVKVPEKRKWWVGVVPVLTLSMIAVGSFFLAHNTHKHHHHINML